MTEPTARDFEIRAAVIFMLIALARNILMTVAGDFYALTRLRSASSCREILSRKGIWGSLSTRPP